MPKRKTSPFGKKGPKSKGKRKVEGVDMDMLRGMRGMRNLKKRKKK